MGAKAPEELRERMERVGRWQVRLTSYRLGDMFHCAADNVDPGGVLARATAPTREAAEAEALEIARGKLATTRILE